MTTQQQIYQRMLDANEFDFASLWVGLPDEAYRMADKTLQQLRRRELAAFRKEGRKFLWSLSEGGKDFVKGKLS